uniref:Uncharacterized protein n=1 Tax=Tanacetum cinerariifolium TaxID=118510 RepID=A0A6L2M6D0_TANCI|nr:hypothetical protein [Tanacetum cinerariifolium]
MVPYEAIACRCGAKDVVLRESYKPKTHGKLYYARPLSEENNFGCGFMERETSPHTGQFSWSFNDSNLFSRIFIDSNLFSRIFNTSTLLFRSFNTSTLFSENFKKCRVLKLQPLAWKDNGVSKWTIRPDRTGKPDQTGPNVFRSGPRSEVLYQFGLRSGRSGPVRADLTKNPKIMPCRTGPDRTENRPGPDRTISVRSFGPTWSRSDPKLPTLHKPIIKRAPQSSKNTLGSRKHKSFISLPLWLFSCFHQQPRSSSEGPQSTGLYTLILHQLVDVGTMWDGQNHFCYIWSKIAQLANDPKKPPTPDRDWNKTLPAVHGSIQPWISELAKQADSRYSFNELMDTPLDFSNFLINRLKVDTLTPELLAGYDKNSLWGVSHWGHKRQQFYGFAINRESAHDVYSKRRIIVVTELKIVEWHSYKHLDWITRRVEDLQLGVESYQKKLNLTMPDTYRSDLKRKEAYTASNP